MNIPLFSSVFIAALIDSVNPCAITILLLMIGLMFSMQKSRRAILTMGFFYILAVYVAYFLIGLGFLKVVTLFNIAHLVAYIAVGILLIIALINLKDYFFPSFLPKLNLRISLDSRQLISDWIFKASIPAIIVVGFLVAITEFPCSGGVYFAILGLLAVKTNFWQGFGYLLFYNFVFVLPLIIIYLITTNRMVAEKMVNSIEGLGKKSQLFMGIAMIVLAIIIYLVN